MLISYKWGRHINEPISFIVIGGFVFTQQWNSMGGLASLQWCHNGCDGVTNLMIVYSTIYSSTDQRKHHSPTSLAFVQGIPWWPVNSPHKGPVTWEMFPFDDVIMLTFSSVDFPRWHAITFQRLHMIFMASQITSNSTVCFNSFQANNKGDIKDLHLLALALCERNQPVTGGFPTQRPSNTECFTMPLWQFLGTLPSLLCGYCE